MVDAKVWFLANGEKKVGPLTAARILDKLATGKLPPSAKAWREGMVEWKAVSQIEELQVLATLQPASDSKSDSKLGLQVEALKVETEDASNRASTHEPVARPEPKPEPKKAIARSSGIKRVERADGKSKVVTRTASRAKHEPVVAEGPFDPPCRIERGDVWRAFGFGLAPRRIGISLASLALAIVISGVLLGMAALAAKVTPLLGIPFALIAAFANFAAVAIGRGALAYDTRRRLEERDPPTIKEALGVALGNGLAHLVPPLLLGFLWLVPVIGLLVLSFGLKIPFLGPVATGVLFCVHLALGAATLYLLVVGASSTAFGPVVASFEGHGLVGTISALVAWPRQGLARAVIAGVLPSLVFGPFATLVIGAGLLALALPLASVGVHVGADVAMWVRSFGSLEPVELPSGLGIGLVPMTFWVALFLAAVASVLVSVSNAIGATAYAVGRPGNEARVSRDTWLARRAAAAESSVGSAVGSIAGGV